MAEGETPAGREQPPEEGIQSGPKPGPAGRVPDPRDGITRHLEPGELRSQQRGRAGPAGSELPGSEAPKETSWLGWASLILGAGAICLVGSGFLRPWAGPLSLDAAIASFASICFGGMLTLPGLTLGLASLARGGRSNSAGVVGSCTNGLILGVLLLLYVLGPLTGWWQPGRRSPAVAPHEAPAAEPHEAPAAEPHDAADFFRRQPASR